MAAAQRYAGETSAIARSRSPSLLSYDAPLLASGIDEVAQDPGGALAKLRVSDTQSALPYLQPDGRASSLRIISTNPSLKSRLNSFFLRPPNGSLASSPGPSPPLSPTPSSAFDSFGTPDYEYKRPPPRSLNSHSYRRPEKRTAALDPEEMRRVLGQLHLRSGTDLKKGKTQKEDAPFGTCLIQHPPLTIIVIGSGFAGFSAAIACARQGFSVTLLEKGSGLSPHGDLISFCPNANRIIRRWGMDDQMWKRAVRGGYMLIKDNETGKTVEQVDNKRLAKKYGSPMFQGHRAQFLGVFGVEARMLGVEVVPYTEVVDILDNLDRPACIAADGRLFYADCVLVADGANSKLRTTVFGVPSQESCAGYSIHRSIAKVTKEFREDPQCSHLLDGNVRCWLGPKSQVFFSPLDNGNQMSISISHPDMDKEASFDWRDIKPMTDVAPLLDGWDPTLQAALRHFRTGLHWRLFHHAPISSWISRNGRIAFLGDAIHTYLPTSFQGATASVEDGATLGLCLALAGGRASGVPLALRAFEALRQDTVAEKADVGFEQREAWNRYHDSRDPADLTLLCERFFDDDAELRALVEFESIAARFAKGYKLDAGIKVQAMQRAAM